MEVVRDGSSDIVVRADFARHRARCADRHCAKRWTVYPKGSYPHRLFQLPVVASAMSEAAFAPQATFSSVARTHRCSRRSVSRWVNWVSKLVQTESIVRLCARLDPQGLPPPRPPSSSSHVAQAGYVLRLFDHLGELLLQRGVSLSGEGTGLARFLLHQFARFGTLCYLTRPCPPLPVDPELLVI